MTLPSPRTADPMDAPPLRWGVLGTGWIADRLFDAVAHHTRQKLVAVGSRSVERAQEFADRHGAARGYGSYEQLVADPDVDAIHIATPHSEHCANALLAIEAGKHVLVEKAFTRNAAEASRVFDAARASGVAVVEAMWTRFLPHIDVLRQLLADGALGDVEAVFADHGQYFEPVPTGRLFDPELAGGAMLDLGVYPVSFAHFVLGAPSSVKSAGTKTITGVDRQVSAVLSGYEATPNAHALINTTLAAKTPTTAFVSGSKARVEIPGAFYAPQQLRVITRDGDVLTTDLPPIEGHQGLAYEVAALATLVAEGRQESELMPWADTIAVLETMDELRRQTGVTLPGETL